MPDAALLAAYGDARVRSTPYAQALSADGTALAAADPVPPELAMTILTDGDWVALQGICAG